MKKILVFLTLILIASYNNVEAQTTTTAEKYGNTLNIGVGAGGYAGYYGYLSQTLPVFHLDYELDAARNFTIAPFINLHTYTRRYWWGNNNTPERYYVYRETIIPVGLKGFYYVDKALHANGKWDFYVAGSVGFAIVHRRWDADYGGDKNYYKTPNPLFLDVHAGTEYHINQNLGMFLDLSSGVSTFGLSFH